MSTIRHQAEARAKKAERAVLKAALRLHNYRERYNPIVPAPGYPNRPDMKGRWATDNIHDKVEELEQQLEKEIAKLAAARKTARR
jgi:hypothetical protein